VVVDVAATVTPASEKETSMTITSTARTPTATRRRDIAHGDAPTRFEKAQLRTARWLAAHSVAALRISLGLVILGFGALKYIPGASPAEDLAMQTTEALTFGIVSGQVAVVATALVETFIGLVLLTGRFLRVGLIAMAGWLGGILAPAVLFPEQMFPGGLPSLAGQYVLKDIILVAAAGVVAAHALGARLMAPKQTHR
jgi:putative oxidoreductase